MLSRDRYFIKACLIHTYLQSSRRCKKKKALFKRKLLFVKSGRKIPDNLNKPELKVVGKLE